MPESLPMGKLRPELLKELLGRQERSILKDPHLVVGPKLGEDAAAIDLGDRYLLLASDPVTFTPERIGWYAVMVNSNDIAAMGGAPRYFLSTILLPERRASDEMISKIFADITEGCRQVECTPVGGHTEVTHGLERPIVCGTMVGDVPRDGLVTSSGARPGDMIVVTNGIAIEATAILAREKAAETVRIFGQNFQEKAARFLEDPGLSVLPASRAACASGAVTALHDPTEGGLANALWEIAEASDVGIVVSETEIPRYWESMQLAEHFGIDLLGAIASGALLVTCPEETTARLLESLSTSGIQGQVIGRVIEPSRGVKLLRGQHQVDLPRFQTDELTRVL